MKKIILLSVFLVGFALLSFGQQLKVENHVYVSSEKNGALSMIVFSQHNNNFYLTYRESDDSEDFILKVRGDYSKPIQSGVTRYVVYGKSGISRFLCTTMSEYSEKEKKNVFKIELTFTDGRKKTYDLSEI